MTERIPRVIKKLSIFVIILIVVFVTCISAIFRIISSPKHLKKSFKQIIETTLDRNVSIGDVRLKFGKLVIKDLEVDFPEGTLNKEAEKFISCEEIKVKFKIMPLFKREFIFREVHIETPEINFLHMQKIDYGELFKKRLDVLFIAKGMSFEVIKLRVVKGEVNFFKPVFPEIHAKNFSVNVGKLADRTFAIDLSGEFRDSKFDKISLSGSIDILKNTALIDLLQINGYEGQINVKGEIVNLIDSPELNVEYVSEVFPAGIFHSALDISGNPYLGGKIKHKDKDLHVNFDMDMSECLVKYKDIYMKPEGEKLRLQCGAIYKMVYFDIDWYILEALGSSFSGTGTWYNNEDIDVNIVSETLEVIKLAGIFNSVKPYIKGGRMNFRGKYKGSRESREFSGKAVIDKLKVSNVKGLSNLYYKLTKKKKSSFGMGEMKAEIFWDNKSFKVKNLEVQGGDIEGWAKGYYLPDNKMNFSVYPRIYGKEIGFRVYGNTDNIKVRLK